MRRAVAAALAATILLPMAAAAEEGLTSRIGERIRQDAWCITLQVLPFLVDVPAGIDCDYEPRAMTIKEAGAYYLHHVARSNYVMDSRNCAVQKASDRNSWRVSRRWSKRLVRASGRWVDALQAVTRPPEARRQVLRLLDREAVETYRLRVAHNKKSAAAAVLSGDWKLYTDANERAAEAAAQVRQALRIRSVPAGNDCRQARRYERQHRRP